MAMCISLFLLRILLLNQLSVILKLACTCMYSVEMALLHGSTYHALAT